MSKLVQKGGTARTTTTAALGVLLSRSGIPVHLVDMDPQASLSRAFGQTDPADRLYHSFASRASLPVDTLAPNLTLSPSSIELARMETEVLTEPGREYFLRTCLERTQLPANAVVLLDCSPSLGILVVNCLATAGGLLTAESVIARHGRSGGPRRWGGESSPEGQFSSTNDDSQKPRTKNFSGGTRASPETT